MWCQAFSVLVPPGMLTMPAPELIQNSQAPLVPRYRFQPVAPPAGQERSVITPRYPAPPVGLAHTSNENVDVFRLPSVGAWTYWLVPSKPTDVAESLNSAPGWPS